MGAILKSKPFTYDGRHLEVRAVQVEDRYHVRVFEGGSPANGVEYRVTIEAAVDAAPLDLVDDLMKSAQGDFIRWSDWQKVETAKRAPSD